MPQIREDVLRKALFCIDEVYPDANTLNTAFFPLERFVDEAAMWVVRSVPIRALGAGSDFTDCDFIPNPDGSGSIYLPQDFVRLIRFRVEGWLRPVTTPIYDTDARYAQQFNKTLRGGDAHPVVVLCDGNTRLEYFSSMDGEEAALSEALYFGFLKVDNNYPENLICLTAWKLAELVLSATHDIQGMQVCGAKITEQIQLL
ncbi:MAG: hypothetical protein RSB23_06775 [Alistipes sp.]